MEPIEELDDPGYADQGMDYYDSDPYSNTYQIDAKLISSDYKDQKILIKTPKFRKIKACVLFKNKDGTVKLIDGKPVVREIVKTRVADGFETLELEFPIQNLHNDSVTSSILTDSDVESIRMIDDVIYDLSLEMMLSPEISFVKTITRLHGIKASIVDSSKGRWGRSAELSKTTITKGESKTSVYHDQKQFDDFEQRKNRKGVFGLGIGPL